MRTVPLPTREKLPAALGVYVYALVDPDEGDLFYIGRGTGDRCVHHAKADLDEPETSDKVERIRRIIARGTGGPDIVILRHALPDGVGAREVAAEIEAAVIDVLIRWKVPLTNLVRGAGVQRGLRTLDSLCAELSAKPLRITASALVVNIGRVWFDGMTDEEVWEAANRWWTASPDRRSPRPSMLLAEAGGIVRGGWALRWDCGVDAVLQRKRVTWDDLDARRRAIYGDPKAFKPKIRCRFLNRDPLPAGCENVVGSRVEGRSFGAAFRYIDP